MIPSPIFIFENTYKLPDQIHKDLGTFFKKVVLVSSLKELYIEMESYTSENQCFLMIDHAIISQFSNSTDVKTHLISLADHPDQIDDNPSVIDVLYVNEHSNMKSQLNRIHRNLLSIIERRVYQHEVNHIYEIGKHLGSERNLSKLMDRILNVSMEISRAEAGSFYSIVDNKNNKWSTYTSDVIDKESVKFEIAKNNKKDLNIQSMTLPLTQHTIVGHTIISGKTINIENAHKIPKNAVYSYDTTVEKKTGYICESILTIPMKDQNSRVLGAIQLINKVRDQKIIPFNSRDIEMMEALSGYAGIAFENTHLYIEMLTLISDYEKMIHTNDLQLKSDDEELTKLSEVIEFNPSALMITNSEGNILYTNSQFATLTGYKNNETLGKRPSILKSNKMEPSFYKTFWDTILTGKEWHGEFLNKRKDGALYWEKTSVSSIKDEQGKIKYFICSRENIDALKDANEKLKTAVDSLKDTQSVLVQNEKMVAIGQLAAGMAHEINNPLGFVISNLNSLSKYSKNLFKTIDSFEKISEHLPLKMRSNFMKTKEDMNIEFIRDDLYELFQESNQGLIRVKKIVEAMRSYSKIDRTAEKGYFSVQNAVETSLVIFNSINASTCSIDTDIQETPEVYGDIAKYQQAFMNILINALESVKLKSDTRDSCLKIRVYAEKGHVKCAVIDSGVGIKEDILPHIFDPFYTSKPVGEGAGLGLSQAYAIINQEHGGEIRVGTKLGVGSTFVIEVPIERN